LGAGSASKEDNNNSIILVTVNKATILCPAKGVPMYVQGISAINLLAHRRSPWLSVKEDKAGATRDAREVLDEDIARPLLVVDVQIAPSLAMDSCRPDVRWGS
jgi:hypothetical protein